MTLRTVRLNDRYEQDIGVVFMSGVQALTRLPMLRRELDRRAGLNTAGFISGYRGSPLGGLDRELWAAERYLKAHDIRFTPGLNEDLAATAVWGTQQVNLFPGARYDGVFGLWYGKGPGVDRSGDALKHANASGTSPHGGVLAVAGDDHVASSSTLPCESDDAFISFGMPLLAPSTVQDILDLGLIGWELSRFAGVWVGFKTIAEIAEATATVRIDLDRFQPVRPESVAFPPDGVHIREPDTPLAKEERLYHYKLPAAKAFSRANGVNKMTLPNPKARLGVAAVGKCYADIREAAAMLDLSDARLADLGMRFLKVNMPWPLDEETVREFGRDLEEILVIEEKRPLVENQMRMALFSHVLRPDMIIVGKTDEEGRPLLSDIGAFSTVDVAEALLGRLIRFNPDVDELRDKLAQLKRTRFKVLPPPAAAARSPYFCSGCPHNTSTRVPEGSRASAGIGCHYMVQWMDRATATFTHMGGEGANWIGQAPFTDEPHMFANLGDGTYAHSGSLAIRAAVAAGVNITYKILYNDAVAMTGGQAAEGGYSVLDILDQVKAEGVAGAVIVTDAPDKYEGLSGRLKGTRVAHRDDLDAVQKSLRDTAGVTVLIYDQMCATEKRRRRKRGTLEAAPERVFINELVCEGCGDCGVKSNCLSVVPVETEFGRKRRIDQSSCNADYSCVKGFCPSFVTVKGATPRRPAPSAFDIDAAVLPPAARADLGRTYNIAVCGVGGTGVLTVGSVLAMAAHLEGKTASVLDQTGLAQKGGAVVSHLRIAGEGRPVDASRIPDGRADVALACDLLVAMDPKAAPLLNPERTRGVLNAFVTPNAAFAFDPNARSAADAAMATVTGRIRADGAYAFDASRLAVAALGDAIFTNMIVVGYAFQAGLLPVGEEAILEAIKLNGAAVEANTCAFRWGRLAAARPEEAETALGLAAPTPVEAQPLAEIVEKRAAFLTASRNAAYAEAYRALVEKVAAAEARRTPGRDGLARAAARYAFKLRAYKDEYEVARLYSDGAFDKALKDQFEGDLKLTFHLAPPALDLFGKTDGPPAKRRFGGWMRPAFGVLAKLKVLRDTPFDPFGRTEERRMERRLITEYEAGLEEMLETLTPDNHALAVEIASAPERIRGYGHVKKANAEKVAAEVAELRAAYFRAPDRDRAA